MPNDHSTDQVVKRPKMMPPCGNDRCESLSEVEIRKLIERKISDSLKSRIDWIKLLSIIVPLVVGFFIANSNLYTRVSVLETKLETFNEIRQDINQIKRDMQDVRERVIRLENRSQ